jgi:DNA-binding response OmpR family regulator
MSEGTEPIGRLDDVRVLIVDDDQDVLESIDAAFQSEGALTALAADGAEAVKICLDDPPDLVVLDMMLPKRSGFLTLEKIKGREDSPIVIMVTANEGKRHQAYAESLGVDRYMLKPVPLERLLSAAVDLIKARGPVPHRARPVNGAVSEDDEGRDGGALDGDEEDKD